MIKEKARKLCMVYNTGTYGTTNHSSSSDSQDIISDLQAFVTEYKTLCDGGDYEHLQGAFVQANQAQIQNPGQLGGNNGNGPPGGNHGNYGNGPPGGNPCDNGGNPPTRDTGCPLRHGLNGAMTKKVNKLIHDQEKTLSERKHIPDEAYYCIEVGGA
eukprot:8746247-Ditylum_brightwellii.AAC.1